MAFRTLKEVKKSLAGGTLTVIQFPVLRAIRVGARVAKFAAPVIAGLGGGLDLDDLISGRAGSRMEEMDLKLNKAIPAALNALAEHLEPEAFALLCQDLLAGATWTDGTTLHDFTDPAAIDRVFCGSIPDLFLALRAALDANDFFGLGAIGKLRGLVRAPSPAVSPDVSIPA